MQISFQEGLCFYDREDPHDKRSGVACFDPEVVDVRVDVSNGVRMLFGSSSRNELVTATKASKYYPVNLVG